MRLLLDPLPPLRARLGQDAWGMLSRGACLALVASNFALAAGHLEHVPHSIAGRASTYFVGRLSEVERLGPYQASAWLQLRTPRLTLAAVPRNRIGPRGTRTGAMGADEEARLWCCCCSLALRTPMRARSPA